MKRSPLVLLTGISTSLLLIACEKKPAQTGTPTPEPAPAAATSADPAPTKVPTHPDAIKLMEAFANAGPEEKSRAGKAAQALGANAHPAALEALKMLTTSKRLTPEQTELVTSILMKLEKPKE